MKFSRVAALLGAMLLFPALAQASAGTVLFALGRVEIQRAGQTLAAQRGVAVEVGDTISTGPTGLAQLRLKDGALLSLKSGSSMTIEDFHVPAARLPVSVAPSAAPAAPRPVAASAADEGGRSVLRLLRGAFRTVTGLIGKGAADSYRVVTPAATIGIRGTDYTAAYCSGDCGSTPDGLYVGVSNGEISISNDSGQLVLGNNQYGYVKDLSTPPNEEMVPPEVLETPIEAEEGDESGEGEGESTTEGQGEGESATEGQGEGAAEGGEPAGDSTPPAESGTAAGDTGAGAGTQTGSTQPEGTYELLPGEPGDFSFSIGPFQGTGNFAGASNNGVYTADDGALIGFLAPDRTRIVFYSIGSAQNVEQGADAATGLRWGRWSGGNANVGGSALNLSNQSLHWIYALAPTAPALPTGGTQSYMLIGNTTPTDQLGNAGFLGSATLIANFTNQTVLSTLDIGINNQVWQASGSGGLANGTPLFSGNYSVGINSAVGSPIGSGSGSFTGFFTDAAAGAGLSYSLSSGSTSVTGAAAFAAQPPAGP